jgi:hypothetical protein
MQKETEEKIENTRQKTTRTITIIVTIIKRITIC